MGKIRPDALLLAFLLFALAALLRYLATNHLRYAGLMGLALSFAYLTRSFAFLFTFLCIMVLVVFSFFWQRQSMSRIAAAALLVLVCFSIVAGPYICALSKQKGRLDFGDSGNLNYAWLVGGTEREHLQQDDTSLFGVAEVRLKHPEERLLLNPSIFSYKQVAYGTYPDWFDPSFFNEHIKTHFNYRLQIAAMRYSSSRVLRYLLDHPQPLVLLLLFFATGARLRLDWRPHNNAFWLVPGFLGLAVIGIYGMVYLEGRYITVGVLMILLCLFATLRLAPSVDAEVSRTAASTVIFLLALLVVGETIRKLEDLHQNLEKTQSTAGWYDRDSFRAAQALNELGIGPGDAVACIGTRACHQDYYWARLAGVRILTEIYVPKTPLYPVLAAMTNRNEAYDVVRREGAKVLVGYFSPGGATVKTLVSDRWHQLDETPFYALPLNLPAEAAPVVTNSRP